MRVRVSDTPSDWIVNGKAKVSAAVGAKRMYRVSSRMLLALPGMVSDELKVSPSIDTSKCEGAVTTMGEWIPIVVTNACCVGLWSPIGVRL